LEAGSNEGLAQIDSEQLRAANPDLGISRFSSFESRSSINSRRRNLDHPRHVSSLSAVGALYAALLLNNGKVLDTASPFGLGSPLDLSQLSTSIQTTATSMAATSTTFYNSTLSGRYST